MEPGAGREHELGLRERLEQLVGLREPQAQPRVVLRLALQARRVREQPADGRRVRRALDVPVERVLEVELARVAQLHDRRRGERLRDRADAVLRVRTSPRGPPRRPRRRPRSPRSARRRGARPRRCSAVRFSRCALRTSRSRRAASRSEISDMDGEHLLHALDRLLDLLVADVEMRDGAQPARAKAADADAPLEEPLAQAGLVGDRDEVRLDGRGVDPDSRRRAAARVRGRRRAARRGGRARRASRPRRCPTAGARRRRGTCPPRRARSSPPGRRGPRRTGSRAPSRSRS